MRRKLCLFLPIKLYKQILLSVPLIAVIIIGAFFTYPAVAKSDTISVKNPPPNALPTTQALLQEIATQAALRHGLNVSKFLAVEACEIKKDSDGSWDYEAQSDWYKNGVRENSWGAFQINLTAHPTISKAEAQDPYWATEWAAQQWDAGHASMWSCWKSL